MSVSNGQKGDATTFNNAYASKSTDNTMVGVQNLNHPSSGGNIANIQQRINDNTSGLASKANLNDARFPSTNEKDALEGSNGTPSSTNKYVTDSDPRLSSSEQVFSIPNNQSSFTDITGLIFDKDENHGLILEVMARRRDDSEERNLIGHLFLTYLIDSDSWNLREDFQVNVDSGIDFNITALGQLQYKSDNMTGTNYFGSFKVSVIKFLKFTS